MKKAQEGFTLVELLIVVGILGIIAAIAIPALLRARVSANEAATIGDIRTVISSEIAYHAANGGVYGELTCLATPSATGCIPAYTSDAPVFLDTAMANTAVAKSGYSRSFSVDTVVGAFGYAANPVSPGKTGTRYFGGDASGRVCFDQAAPMVFTQASLPQACNVAK